MSELMNHSSQIELLHKKASEGDFLSRFNYEYLSFIAHLNNNLYLESKTDVESIQKLKSDKILRAEYMAQISYHRLLKKVWNSVIEESLQELSYKQSGVQNLEDWENMIEFWYQTRKKSYDDEPALEYTEDKSAPEQAYFTLSFFMESQIKKLSKL
ncbi:hypothetical protein DOM21_07140 [Bacteriovorax stolpii]|uniref:hypothetical protein n=1 Tax=Bacteriovorax stolpii TaxID=960 RepID=UPI001157235E|nr:hypothetical protein [Bacteriovorax stolpii]QDK41234.1 hypothetical protein DOM21_07140 [Bacteriovorax stolpii]